MKIRRISIQSVLRRLLVPVLLALGIAGRQSAHADTLNVPAQYPTIQDAVNAAHAGDTVLVADGTYTGGGNKNVGVGSGITVKSSGGAASCIIDCQQSGRAFVLRGTSRVEGFTIKNGRVTATLQLVATYAFGGGIYAYGTDPIVANCLITNNTLAGVHFSILEGCGMFRGTAINCIFTNNIGIASGSNPQFSIFGSALYFGIAIHCTFFGNAATRSGVINRVSATNCIIQNKGGVSVSPPDSAVTYSNVQGGYEGTGNINVDPLFVNADGGDFHLLANSPCIDAGTAAGITLPATDLDGNLRIRGSAPDMGAYETFGRTVTGTVLFQGSVPNAPARNVTFQLRPVGGDATQTFSRSVPASGEFTLGVPADNYTLLLQSDHYLSRRINLDTTNGDVTGVTALLKSGDANRDNAVDIADLLVLIAAYNQPRTSIGYNEAADFNLDGANDIADLLLLIGNYNQIGD